MSDLALFIVRASFVIILWIFIFSVISVVRSDLFGQKLVRRVVKDNSPKILSSPVLPQAAARASTQTELIMPKASDSNQPSKIVADRLLITAGDKAGYQLKLDRREITIGRSESSDLVIDDEFASTNHAKLVKSNEEWTLQDLGSTNGTFLDGVKVTTPVTFKVGSEVRIGKTAFELRG
jgi:pSer/pThr/pTyr-binding forkhead associated (FHA) protein